MRSSWLMWLCLLPSHIKFLMVLNPKTITSSAGRKGPWITWQRNPSKTRSLRNNKACKFREIGRFGQHVVDGNFWSNHIARKVLGCESNNKQKWYLKNAKKTINKTYQDNAYKSCAHIIQKLWQQVCEGNPYISLVVLAKLQILTMHHRWSVKTTGIYTPVLPFFSANNFSKTRNLSDLGIRPFHSVCTKCCRSHLGTLLPCKVCTQPTRLKACIEPAGQGSHTKVIPAPSTNLEENVPAGTLSALKNGNLAPDSTKSSHK